MLKSHGSDYHIRNREAREFYEGAVPSVFTGRQPKFHREFSIPPDCFQTAQF